MASAFVRRRHNRSSMSASRVSKIEGISEVSLTDFGAQGKQYSKVLRTAAKSNVIGSTGPRVVSLISCGDSDTDPRDRSDRIECITWCRMCDHRAGLTVLTL